MFPLGKQFDVVQCDGTYTYTVHERITSALVDTKLA